MPDALLLMPPFVLHAQATLSQQKPAANPGSAHVQPQLRTMRRFDLPYMALPLPTDILRAWQHPPSASSIGLALPQRNHFIPTDFSLRAPTADSGKDARAMQAAQAILTAVHDVAAKVCLPLSAPVVHSCPPANTHSRCLQGHQGTEGREGHHDRATC